MTTEEFKVLFHNRYDEEYIRVLRNTEQSDEAIWRNIERLLPVWGEKCGVVVDRQLKDELRGELDKKMRETLN